MVFIKNWDELYERMDPAFYLNMMLLDKNIIKKSKFQISSFKKELVMRRGRFGHRPRNDARYFGGDVPFIQTGNIVEASQANCPIAYTQTLNELGVSASKLFDTRVVVMTIAANIGYTAILDYPACFPDSLVALIPKGENIDLRYLNLYIRFIRTYIENLAPQAAQKNINLRQLGEIPIVIPKMAIQLKIVQIMNKAYEHKILAQNESELLRKKLHEYILKEFTISETVKSMDSIKERMFYVNMCELLGNRFDPEYHKPVFRENLIKIFNGKYAAIELRKVINSGFIKGVLPSEEQKGGVCKVVQIRNINMDGTIDISKVLTSSAIYSDRQRLQRGDILVVITGATIGKIGFWDYDDVFYLGGDIVKFNTGNYYLNLIYAALMRTQPYQMQIKRYITGATNGHLAIKDIEKLPVPNISDAKEQERVAKYIIQCDKKIQLLKKDAIEEMEAAKKHIEEMLLGE